MASELTTDIDGRAALTVGEHNPYGYSIHSAIGDTPEPGRLQVATDEIMPYETVPVTATIPGTMPAPPQASQTDLTGGDAPEAKLELRFDVESYRVAGDGQLEGSFSWNGEGGRIDAYLLDEANYSSFLAGEPFEALAMAQASEGATISGDLPRTKSWILVLASTGWLASAMVGSMSVSAEPYEGYEWSGEAPALERRFRILPGGHLAVTLNP